MDAPSFARRVRDALIADRDAGRLAPLSVYLRRFKGFDELVTREYGHVEAGGGATNAGAAPDVTGSPTRAAPSADAGDAAAERARETQAGVGAPSGSDGHAASSPSPSSRPAAARYTHLGEIARGGMGAILRVRDGELERELAMKVVLGRGARPGTPGSAGPLERRFLEEAKITAALDHPGVVPVHELGTDDDGRLYFTMKLIRGGRTLAQVFERSRAGDPDCSLARVVQIFVRVLETLAFAHDKGIVHRDLKPANVMVGDFGEVYVMDWGLAKALGGADDDDDLRRAHAGHGADAAPAWSPGALTEAGQVLGTPAYMPIEQARNDRVDARADVYAVGAMLYEYFAGEAPYHDPSRRRSAAEVAVAVLAGPPPPLTEIAPATPPEVLSILTKAMARERSARYGTAMEFAQDLRNFVEGRVVLAHEAGAWAEFRKWVRRNRALAAAVAAAAFALVSGLAVSIRFGIEADRERDTARRHAYRSGIGAAISDLSNRDIYAARRRLEQTPEELRGWEWRHLTARLDESLLVIEGTGMTLTATGALRTVDRGGAVREHDLARGTSRALAVVPRDGAEAWISRDGSTVCVVAEVPGRRDHYDVRFHPIDGSAAPAPLQIRIWDRMWDRGFRMPRFVYNGMDGSVRVLNVLTGRETTPEKLGRGTEHWAMTLESATGAGGRQFLLVAQGNEEAVIFDVDADRVAARLRFPRAERPTRLAVSGDGRLAALLGEDGGIEIRDLASGERTPFGRVPARAREGFIAFHPSGRLIATGGRDRAVRLYDTATGAQLRVLQGHLTMVQEGTFTADGEFLVTRDAGHQIRVWPARDDDPTLLRGHASYVYTVEFSPDGRRLASGGWDGFADRGGALRIWDAETGAPLAALGDAERGLCVFTLAWSADGRRILTVGGERPEFRGGPLRIWDAESGALLRECAGTYRTLGVHPAGRIAVAMQFGSSMEHDGDVCHVLDIETGDVLATFLPKPISWAAFSVDPAFSPDGTTLATTSADASEVVLWDTARWREIRRIPAGGGALASVTFSPDGTRLLTTADDESWSVFDVRTGARQFRQHGTGNEVLTGEFAPDGTWILTGGRDRTLRIWDAASFDEIARLTGHDDYIKSVAASPDRDRLASASGDGSVRIWQTRDAATLHRAQIERRELAAALAPEVEALFAASGDAASVVSELRLRHAGRTLEVALQLALTASVGRSARK